MFRVFLLLLRPLLLVEEPHGGRERGGSVGDGSLYTADEHQGKRLAITGSRVQQPESGWSFFVAGGDIMRFRLPASEVNRARYGPRSMRSIVPQPLI